MSDVIHFLRLASVSTSSECRLTPAIQAPSRSRTMTFDEWSVRWSPSMGSSGIVASPSNARSRLYPHQHDSRVSICGEWTQVGSHVDGNSSSSESSAVAQLEDMLHVLSQWVMQISSLENQGAPTLVVRHTLSSRLLRPASLARFICQQVSVSLGVEAISGHDPASSLSMRSRWTLNNGFDPPTKDGDLAPRLTSSRKAWSAAPSFRSAMSSSPTVSGRGDASSRMRLNPAADVNAGGFLVGFNQFRWNVEIHLAAVFGGPTHRLCTRDATVASSCDNGTRVPLQFQEDACRLALNMSVLLNQFTSHENDGFSASPGGARMLITCAGQPVVASSHVVPRRIVAGSTPPRRPLGSSLATAIGSVSPHTGRPASPMAPLHYTCMFASPARVRSDPGDSTQLSKNTAASPVTPSMLPPDSVTPPLLSLLRQCGFAAPAAAEVRTSCASTTMSTATWIAYGRMDCSAASRSLLSTSESVPVPQRATWPRRPIVLCEVRDTAASACRDGSPVGSLVIVPDTSVIGECLQQVAARARGAREQGLALLVVVLRPFDISAMATSERVSRAALLRDPTQWNAGPAVALAVYDCLAAVPELQLLKHRRHVVASPGAVRSPASSCAPRTMPPPPHYPPSPLQDITRALLSSPPNLAKLRTTFGHAFCQLQPALAPSQSLTRRSHRHGDGTVGNTLVPSRSALATATVAGQWAAKFVLALSPECSDETSVPLGIELNQFQPDMSDQQLILIDQHAAHERMRLDSMLSEGAPSRHVSSHRLPQDHALQHLGDESPLLWARCQRHRVALGYWGWTACPHRSGLASCPALTLEHVTTVFDDGASVLEYLDCLDETARTTCEDDSSAGESGPARWPVPCFLHRSVVSRSCHGAIKFGDRLSETEMASLILALATRTRQYDVCSHGRPSMTVICTVPSHSRYRGPWYGQFSLD